MNYDDLNKLNELKEKGILSEEEFQKEKAKLLDDSNTNTSQATYYQNQGAPINDDPNQKSKLVAGLLGIFLGSFGVHNFYLGFTKKAVAQLLITLLSCGFLAAISAIWGLIEGILILAGEKNTDAQGRPLKGN